MHYGQLHKTLIKLGSISIIICFCLAILSFTESERYDFLIKNTTIVDGTGKTAFRGSIAIDGEKIVAIGKVKGDAITVIDGSKLVTCPGFIDPHSHADINIMKYPLAENLVMQGITSFWGGNCGISPAPKKDLTFEEWLSKVEEEAISVNYIPLVGHSTIRNLVMGDDFRRKATSGEIEGMQRHLEKAMKEGAFGFSVGLDPIQVGFEVGPGYYATTEEIIEIAETARRYGGIFVPHTRRIQFYPLPDYIVPPYLRTSESYSGVYRGYMEAIEIARKTKIPLHIAHMTTAYRIATPRPDFLEEAAGRATIVEVVDKARKEGIELTFDLMAYHRSVSACSFLLDAFFWRTNKAVIINRIEEIEKEEFVEKLQSQEFRKKLKEEYESGRLKIGRHEEYPYWMNYHKILRCTKSEYVGKTIAEIATMKNADVLDVLFDVLIEDQETIWASMYDPRMHPAANEAIMLSPYGMPSIDDGAYPAKPEGLEIPPIAFGMFPYYINRFVKERGYLSLEEAIRKATLLPAQTIGVEDRGVIRSGAYADILVFDFKTIKDRNDFLNPTTPPAGIEYVFVNGTVVYEKGVHTKKKPGKVLRHINLN